MASHDTVTIVDCSTGEIEQRPLTDEEQQDRNVRQTRVFEEAAAASAKRDVDEKAWRDAVGNATTFQEFKTAFLGTNLNVIPEVREKPAPQKPDTPTP